MARTNHSKRKAKAERAKRFDPIAHARALSLAHFGVVQATKFHSTKRGVKDYHRKDGKEIPQD